MRGIPQLPFHPDPLHPEGKLASPLPQDPPLPSRAAPSPRPRATLGDPAAGPPHLSAGLAKPPDLLLGSRLREPPPGHPPRAGGGGGGCDPNGPLHAPGRAAGGRGASHAGRGRWGGARSPSRTEPREPGTRAPGGELGGGVPGRAPAAALLPRGARGRPAPKPREEGTGGDGGGPQRPGLPGPRPAAGCARSLPDQRRAGPYHSSGGGGNDTRAGSCSPPVRSLRTDTPAGKCIRSLGCYRPGNNELPRRETEVPVGSALTLPSPSLAPERRHFWPVHLTARSRFPPRPRPACLPI